MRFFLFLTMSVLYYVALVQGDEDGPRRVPDRRFLEQRTREGGLRGDNSSRRSLRPEGQGGRLTPLTNSNEAPVPLGPSLFVPDQRERRRERPERPERPNRKEPPERPNRKRERPENPNRRRKEGVPRRREKKNENEVEEEVTTTTTTTTTAAPVMSPTGSPTTAPAISEEDMLDSFLSESP